MGHDDLFKKRKARKNIDLQRERHKRAQNKRYLIVCEGTKTEPYYFQSLLEDIGIRVGSRTIGYLKTSVRCCMAERYFEKFWQHGKPVPRSCHADQSS